MSSVREMDMGGSPFFVEKYDVFSGFLFVLILFLLQRGKCFCDRIRNQFKKDGIGIVDDQGRCAGKELMGPGIRKDMHGDSDRLQAAVVFCQFDRVGHELAVGAADQPVFVPVTLCGPFPGLRIQVSGQEMK